jgi:CPA2 family monovalent cation:H+ antiporter-2
MLFDPTTIIREPWSTAATLLIIVVGKSLAAFVIVLAFRYPIATVLTISASLAQVGEFSFILAEFGVNLKLLPSDGRDLILAGAILSILLNPLMFAIVDRLSQRIESRLGPVAAATPTGPPSPDATALTDHTILVGYGRVGRIIGTDLRERNERFLVIETSDPLVAELRETNIEAIAGNAAEPDVLMAANLEGSKYVIIAIPEAFEAGQIVQQARAANPNSQIIARAHSDAEVEHLNSLGADTVIMGEREIARGMIEDFCARQAQKV